MGIYINNAFLPGITIKSGISTSNTSSIPENGLYNVAAYSSITATIPDLFLYRICGSTYTLSLFSNTDWTYVAPYTFGGVIKATEYYLPNVKSIDTGAFISAGCSNYNFPELEYIGEQAFSDINANIHISTFNAPKVKTIGQSAFYYASYLQSISFPDCTTIYNSAFYNCTRLSAIYLPNCSTIYSSAFQYCSSLTTLVLLKCERIYSGAFCYCSRLTDVTLPNCTQLDSNAFMSCYNLTTVSLSKCS